MITAELYSKYLGKSVTYTSNHLDGWAEQQRQFLSERIVGDLRAMCGHFLENGYLATEEDIKQSRTILGKEPRSYEAFVNEVTAQWRKQDEMDFRNSSANGKYKGHLPHLSVWPSVWQAWKTYSFREVFYKQIHKNKIDVPQLPRVIVNIALEFPSLIW